MRAAKNNDLKLMQFMLKLGADPDTSYMDDAG